MDHIGNNLVMLSDKSKVDNVSWKELKKNAMKPNFKKSIIYTEYNKDQKLRVNRLIAA